MDIVYNIRLTGASSTPSKKTGPVLDVAFNFDGRLKSGQHAVAQYQPCLLYTSPSPRDVEESRMPSSA